jgi:hypothetical protein
MRPKALNIVDILPETVLSKGHIVTALGYGRSTLTASAGTGLCRRSCAARGIAQVNTDRAHTTDT